MIDRCCFIDQLCYFECIMIGVEPPVKSMDTDDFHVWISITPPFIHPQYNQAVYVREMPIFFSQDRLHVGVCNELLHMSLVLIRIIKVTMAIWKREALGLCIIDHETSKFDL